MIHTGDCIEVMAAMDADSVDAIVTDPPYGLGFMGKAWDSPAGQASWTEAGGALGIDHKLTTDRSGSMKAGKYDWSYSASVAFGKWCEAWGREALRVTKPGGYLLAFGGTRTHHRLVCGLEDAGWIIRDELDWIYASGFPKGKANLKPAHEPIVLARKPGPLQPLAIDECRIGTDAGWSYPNGRGGSEPHPMQRGERNGLADVPTEAQAGRWPSNVLLSDPALFDEPNAEVVGSGATADRPVGAKPIERPEGFVRFNGGDYNNGNEYVTGGYTSPEYGDSGGYSRFFIVPKADRADREPVVRGQLNGDSVWSDGREKAADYPSQRGKTNRENAHPTVKPVDLMRHLVRLVTPQGGTVLDPFLGSGSTAIAAELEGFAWVGIEKEPEYVAIAEARLNGTQRGLGLDVPAPDAPRKSVDGVAVNRNRPEAGSDYAATSYKIKLGPGPDATYRQPKPERVVEVDPTAPMFPEEVP